MKAKGTTPLGAASEAETSRWIRKMFSDVAPRYDLLNHLLSANLDKLWRAHTVARLKPYLRGQLIDLCCGTGDLARALEQAGAASIFATDFCHPMLVRAQKKHLRSPLFEADGLRLPLRDRSADVLTVAFGFRNYSNYRAGLVEMLRVLKPGGIAAILEMSTPPNPAFAAVYGFYAHRVLPKIGALVSGSNDAYSYLPESVRKFPGAAELAEDMRSAGFERVGFERLTFGIVALHLGFRPKSLSSAPSPTPFHSSPSR